MTTYTLSLTLLADTLISSGEGFGAIIDSDIIFDDVGLPYIPARRIKGCLRDAAKQVAKMPNQLEPWINIEKVFGEVGSHEPASTIFSNFYLPEYQANYQWLKYLKQKKKLSWEQVANYFTCVRYQTAIKDGVTKPHSLRSFRAAQKGLVFVGKIEALDDPEISRTLALACLQFQHMGIGAKRNRGFGELRCDLKNENQDVIAHTLEKLEASCTA